MLLRTPQSRRRAWRSARSQPRRRAMDSPEPVRSLLLRCRRSEEIRAEATEWLASPRGLTASRIACIYRYTNNLDRRSLPDEPSAMNLANCHHRGGEPSSGAIAPRPGVSVVQTDRNRTPELPASAGPLRREPREARRHGGRRSRRCGVYAPPSNRQHAFAPSFLVWRARERNPVAPCPPRRKNIGEVRFRLSGRGRNPTISSGCLAPCLCVL